MNPRILAILNSRFYSPDDDITIGDVDDADVLEEDDKEGKDKDDDSNKEDKEDVNDEDDKEDRPDDDDSGEEDDEDDKDKDDDKEDEDEDEEDSDKDDVKLSTITDIKKEFPDFFKKFPDIKAALFREDRYASIFESPDAAEEANEKALVLDSLNKDLIEEGNPTNFLKTLETGNKESYEKVMLSILPYLQETNKDLFYTVAAIPIKQLLRSAWREGKGKDTDLGRAAAYINKYFFGDTDVEKGVKGEGKVANDKSEKEKEYEKRLSEIEERDYRNFEGAVNQSYVRRMTDHIRESLDKDDRLNEYTKSKLVEDILIEIKNTLDKDKRYRGQIAQFYKNAKANNYSSDFKSRIISTALARAKSLTPEVRKRLVSHVLGKKKSKDTDDDKKEKKIITHSRSRDKEDKNINKRPLTDMDILNEA